MTVYPDCPICIPAQSLYSNLSVSQSGAVGQSQVMFCLGLSLNSWISVLLEHVNHWIPGLAESKTSVPVKLSGVEPDLSSLFYHAFCITCGCVQDGHATEISAISCFKFVLCHSGFL